jgi:cell division topological specificity factor
MNPFRIFGRGATAPAAKERLQILLAHERRSGGGPDLLAILHREVLDAIAKHVSVDPDKVALKVDRRETMSVLEIDIEIDAKAVADRAA